ncbi:cytochrome P450 [Aspergillus fruticulosus]
MAMSVLTLALAVVAGGLLSQYTVTPAFLSPLSRIPAGHCQENKAVLELHQKYGHAVRLAPTPVSLNYYKVGLKQIYLGGFPKSNFYFNRFALNGYNKASRLKMLGINYSYAMDTFVHWQFRRSAGSDLVRIKQERHAVLDVFLGIVPYNFWLNELPQFCRRISKLGVHLIPISLSTGFRRIDQWNTRRCDKVQNIITARCDLRQQMMEDHEYHRVVFAQACESMASSDPRRQTAAEKQVYNTRIKIAADMLMLDGAAVETTGATLTYNLFEISRNSEIQERLRQKLHTLYQTPSYPGKGTATDLPLAIELRLYPTVPGRQPRVVPQSCSLGSYDNIPAGTTVHCSTYSLHRTPEAFEIGGRMCIGRKFAIYSMKYLIGAIYSNYRAIICDREDMEQQDGYVTGLKGQRLELIFESC